VRASELRDAKRFLVCQWRLVQVGCEVPLKLPRAFFGQFGVFANPMTSVTGIHFAMDGEGR